MWNCALIAQVVGHIPNFSTLQKLVNLMWGNGEELDLRFTGKNHFVVDFPSMEVRDYVLVCDPWFV